MNANKSITLIMVDDDLDEIFLTRREVRNQGIVNRFISERYAENLLTVLTELSGDEESSGALILLDVKMPGSDGFETLQKLRAHAQFKDLPVIMFSASDDPIDIRQALSLGADGYMVKPFSMQTFLGAVGKMAQLKYNLVQ
jgi:DNA-binding response OmpR family regulator